ncbi:hypothetical protein QBC46DRAFT_57306 [Diplogelasinospora grovesii]|uniref:Uncharacterized protein n=1 Tax=Diplogelasinospora grovesii TaxID=303347 RepID=A0AAN6NBR5_9PEZI|nr:hypothetical protein QBC46DRAFT_57306 [Diplogelasinospora grovesii]
MSDTVETDIQQQLAAELQAKLEEHTRRMLDDEMKATMQKLLVSTEKEFWNDVLDARNRRIDELQRKQIGVLNTFKSISFVNADRCEKAWKGYMVDMTPSFFVVPPEWEHRRNELMGPLPSPVSPQRTSPDPAAGALDLVGADAGGVKYASVQLRPCETTRSPDTPPVTPSMAIDTPDPTGVPAATTGTGRGWTAKRTGSQNQVDPMAPAKKRVRTSRDDAETSDVESRTKTGDAVNVRMPRASNVPAQSDGGSLNLPNKPPPPSSAIQPAPAAMMQPEITPARRTPMYHHHPRTR